MSFLQHSRRSKHTAASDSPGKTDLISWWALGEASGNTRVDSHGSNDLTESATVNQATGVVGNCADFDTGASSYLSISDNASLSLGTDTDFTIGMWFKPTSDPTSTWAILLQKHDNFIGGPQGAYQIYRTSSSFFFRVGNNSSSQVVTHASVTNDTWSFIVCRHDSAADEISITIDADASTGRTTAAWTGGTYDSTHPFVLGDQFGTSWNARGQMDEVFFYKGRVLTDDEETWLYNSGSGRAYADL